MAAVTYRNLAKSYGTAQVIRDLNLEIKDGEFVVLVGPSGCGKSTLLRMTAGLEEISGGEVSIQDQVVNDLPPGQRSVAMVYQNYALYPHMTAWQNMAFGLENVGTPKSEIQEIITQTAEKLQITPLLNRYPKDMSGGQRQRVAIGRAMVRKPDVFLFDEPLSNLDAALRVQMRLEIARLHKILNNTIIFVTHDQVEAMTLAERIVVLNGGNIEQVGTPSELYRTPRNLFVAKFIGSPQMNILDVEHQGGLLHISGTPLACPANLHAADVKYVGIRPEHLTVAAGNQGLLSGQIDLIENLGDRFLVHVTLQAGETVIATASSESELHSGDTITLDVAEPSCHFFGADEMALDVPAMQHTPEIVA